MSITIGGHTWRTLEQPLYAGGQLVKEVYADGVKVYPETREYSGRYFKVRGRLLIQDFHSHGPEDLGVMYRGGIGQYAVHAKQHPSTAVFTQDATFVAVFDSDSPSRECSCDGKTYSMSFTPRRHSLSGPDSLAPDGWNNRMSTMTNKYELSGLRIGIGNYVSIVDFRLKLNARIPVCGNIESDVTWSFYTVNHVFDSVLLEHAPIAVYASVAYKKDAHGKIVYTDDRFSATTDVITTTRFGRPIVPYMTKVDYVNFNFGFPNQKVTTLMLSLYEMALLSRVRRSVYGDGKDRPPTNVYESTYETYEDLSLVPIPVTEILYAGNELPTIEDSDM